ncbi:MAG: pyridoxamine 5'-phosphate oxidase family protein [Desulfohalobiaceae bacterium]|nr:pyridoxamine 5'-phosphate oxidase family protein [Desulfohalobiaceae bacterium]
MRRKEKEIRDKAEMQTVLEQGRICRLGLLNGNRPYIVPMNYGYADNCLYFHSAKEGMKVELLKKDTLVCFEVDCKQRLVKGDTGCGWTMHYQSVIGYGRVEFLETRQDKKNGLRWVMAQYAPGKSWDFPDRKLDQTLVFRLSIEEMTGKKSGV